MPPPHLKIYKKAAEHEKTELVFFQNDGRCQKRKMYIHPTASQAIALVFCIHPRVLELPLPSLLLKEARRDKMACSR